MASGSQDAVSVYAELSCAIAALRARGLQQSVKWAAEQLVGLPEGCWEAGAAQAAKLQPSEPEHPRLVQGRCFFELKEYTRAAHVLVGVGGAVATFLRCYALFLAGEKAKEQARVEASGPLGAAVTPNPHLDTLGSELEAAAAAGLADGYTAYLAGLVELERGHQDAARQLLVTAVQACPCHWGAWQALIGLCPDLEAVSGLELPPHWATSFFLAGLCLELQANAEALSRLQLINQMFPGSDWVASCAALAHYNCRNFDAAQALYEDLLERDPWRLQGMDTYSNILFVKEAFGPLSHLAHRMAATDKYTPEACCVIGNYYSLKGQHERSIEWFRRALRLCRTYLSAWTLMGHEYVEIKNAPAAIDAYRNAVAINPHDYRAWYGLGQTYELLSMPHYALHYYRRAALLRPTDPRMWCALGHCYEAEGLALPDLALRCYRRAVAHGDREGIGLAKLAKLHEAQGERAAAGHYHALNLARLDAEGASGSDATEALLFLAEYAKDCGMLSEAEGYCQRLMDVGGPANMRAKAILRDIRSSSSKAGGGGGGGGDSTPAAAGAAGGGQGGGGLSGRMGGGARRVLGEAGGGDTATPPAFGGFRQQQQQQRGMATPGLVQQTPGAFSMVLDDDDDDDDDMALLTGGSLPPAQHAAAHLGQQHQQQQQQQQLVTPMADVTPGHGAPMSVSATPAMAHLLRPGGRQQQRQDAGAAGGGAGGSSLLTPLSALGGGDTPGPYGTTAAAAAAAPGPGGRRGVAAALFTTPPGGGAAAAQPPRAAHPPPGPPLPARRGGAAGSTAAAAAVAAAAEAEAAAAAAATAAAAAEPGDPAVEPGMVQHLSATTGASSEAAAAALRAAGGDLMHAMAQLSRWQQQQQQQREPHGTD